MNIRTDSLKTLGWGVLWLVVAVYWSLNVASNLRDDLRLLLYAKTANAQIVDTWEDVADGEDGQLHMSSAVTYTFTLPDGTEVTGASSVRNGLPPEWANLKSPIPVEVEYVPAQPSLNRLQGEGSQSLLGWTWRTALSFAVLAFLVNAGVKLTRNGFRQLRLPPAFVLAKAEDTD